LPRTRKIIPIASTTPTITPTVNGKAIEFQLKPELSSVPLGWVGVADGLLVEDGDVAVGVGLVVAVGVVPVGKVTF
jgi:hypothetical protein